jgi:hypothetical protein
LGSTGLPPMAVLEKCASLMCREFQWSGEQQQHEIQSVIQSYPFQHTGFIAA